MLPQFQQCNSAFHYIPQNIGNRTIIRLFIPTPLFQSNILKSFIRSTFEMENINFRH